MNTFSNMTSYLLFPVLMGGALLAQHFSVNYGMEPAISAVVISLSAMMVIALFERLLPYRHDWNKSDGDIQTDAINALVTQIAIPKLMEPIWVAIFIGLVAWLVEAYGANGIWPHDWPLLIQLFLMLLIAEFGRYWVHRAAHEIPVLWRFHAVHHSPKRLYFLNAARFHPLEKLLFLIPEVVPFVLLGTNVECLAMYAVFNSVHGLLQHSNIKLRCGWLNYLFSMTELHRWHHSQVIEESNRNYGNNLILWDRLFGTFYWPKENEVEVIGLINPDYPKGYFAQLAAPFATKELSKPANYYNQQVSELAEVREQSK